jgi:Holliday junction resolvase
MSLNRYAKRRDENEQEIVDALEAIGCSVVRLDKPVDLLVGHQARNYLLEVKGEKGRLTKGQQEFMKMWRGQVRVVTTAEEAIEVILGCYVSTDSTDLPRT